MRWDKFDLFIYVIGWENMIFFEQNNHWFLKVVYKVVNIQNMYIFSYISQQSRQLYIFTFTLKRILLKTGEEEP